jgi:hypothetical protein
MENCYRVLEVSVLSYELGPPASECVLPPRTQEGVTLACGAEGVGGPNSDEGRKLWHSIY